MRQMDLFLDPPLWIRDPIKEEAEARHLRHIGHPTHRPLSPDYELVGLRGEEALAEFFGKQVDLVARPGGDGKKDQVLKFSGSVYKVDVKAARKPYNLICEATETAPETIYILAHYVDATDSATLLGWQWGRVLMRSTPRTFPPHRVLNHHVRAETIRRLTELLERYEQ